MKIVMTLAVRNEQDILKKNLDYHLYNGVDFFIVTDNLSTDNTKNILTEYINKGVLYYIYNDENTHDQAKWVTNMCRLAHELCSPDWIINCDADEFWWTDNLDLKSFFKSQKSNFINVPRFDFIPIKQSNPDNFFYEEMVYKRTKSSPIKCAHRSSSKITVGFGNHYATHPIWGRSTDVPIQDYNHIQILHYPLRSVSQALNKTILGAQAILNNQNYGPGCCKQWKSRYKRIIEKKDSSNKIIEDIFYNEKKIKHLINAKCVTVDLKLKNFFNQIYRN